MSNSGQSQVHRQKYLCQVLRARASDMNCQAIIERALKIRMEDEIGDRTSRDLILECQSRDGTISKKIKATKK